MARPHGIRVDEAYERMRRHARNHNRKLKDVVQAILSDPAGVADLAGA